MKRIKTFPGAILKVELKHRGLSANRFALALGVPTGRITEILHGKRTITPDTAIRIGAYFGNEPQFWLNLQNSYDLSVLEHTQGPRIRSEVRPPIEAVG